MHELILHHYPTSPFAEKARLMLGFKQLSWRSVMIPPVMPAGSHRADWGYRRTPVLQVGADIYCDTALIARRLEAEKATPALFPEGQEFTAATLAQWADSVLFLNAVSLVFQPESMALRFAQVPKEFVQVFSKDRAQLFANGSVSRVPLEQAKSDWPVFMSRLQQQLARERASSCWALRLRWRISPSRTASGSCVRRRSPHRWWTTIRRFVLGSARCWASAMARAARCLARMPRVAREAEPAALPEEALADPNGFRKASR